MYISFLDSLYITKIITISDLIFLISSIILLIVSGSYITIKGNIYFASGKIYTIAVIYTFIVYIILTNNLSDKGLTYLSDSVMFTSYNMDYTAIKFLNLLYFFSLVFLIILNSYISYNRLKTTFEYPIIIIIAILGMIILLKSTDLFIWFLTIEMQSFCFYT